jgi:hypothetical protein
LPDSGPGEARGLVRVYRAGGGLAFLVGLGFLLASAAGRPLTSAHEAPGDARVLGACFALLGACFAARSLSRRSARGPRFLASDPLAARPARGSGERAAGAAVWLLCALWIWFGLRLLSAR